MSDEPNTKHLSSPIRKMLILVGALVITSALTLVFWPRNKDEKDEAEKEKQALHTPAAPNEIVVPPEALSTAGIEVGSVTEQPIAVPLKVAGTVEANAQQEQAVISQVAGRVTSVKAVLGQRVARGEILASIQSQQIAELHGQLLEAESKLTLANKNLELVRKTANQANIISAKAKLDLAEKTLARQRKLAELGAIPTKDVQATETEYETAKAEYEFQSQVAITREIKAAENEREAARVSVERLRQSLSALGAYQPDGKPFGAVTAPVSGVVIKREVNPGAAVQEGDPLFTIANIGTVWIIASVSESQIGHLQAGMQAEIRSVALGQNLLTGRVTYIDPLLNTETHTVRVRVEVANPGERLKVGMFVDVEFKTGEGTRMGLVVPDEAVQRIGERTIVFVPKAEAGHFEVRYLEIGGLVDGNRQIISGLSAGEQLVTKRAFALKSQLLKGTLEDPD